MWSAPHIEQSELLDAEAAIVRAFETQNIDHLRVFGFGELGIAIGWPTESPTVILKRQAPGPRAMVDSDEKRMVEYQRALIAQGVSVLPNTFNRVDLGNGHFAPYIVQPIVDSEDLLENVLATATPAPDNECLLALRKLVVDVVSDTPELGLSIDAQVTNFAWKDGRLHTLDTTPPLIWDADSGPFYDVGNYLLALPAPLRSTALRITRRVGDDYRTADGALFRTVVYLKRIGEDRWVEPAMECFNAVLDKPVTFDAVEKEYQQAVKDFPRIKMLARIQRRWTRDIRRRRYEFFITDSFKGEIL
ncbi:MAG: hypothetical protein EX269_14470 [Acidimicrobiales bacterium]|nr:MAG: hypothetical protein EX269_14470 [Acidimicrobiales bacterium]